MIVMGITMVLTHVIFCERGRQMTIMLVEMVRFIQEPIITSQSTEATFDRVDGTPNHETYKDELT